MRKHKYTLICTEFHAFASVNADGLWAYTTRGYYTREGALKVLAPYLSENGVEYYGTVAVVEEA